MKRLVRFLDLFNPHIELVQLFVDQVLKVIRGVEDAINTTHKEGEEDKSDELESDREKELIRGFTTIVTVADCCNNFKNPVKCKYILSMLRLVRKSIRCLSIIYPTALASVSRILGSAAIPFVSKIQPEACINVICVYDT